MVTLKQAVRRACEISHDFGIVVPITSLTATTITVDALKIGQDPTQYANRFAYRFDAASGADGVRQVTEFVGSTGVLTHAGANYSDTTATSEYLVLSPFDPFTLRGAAQEVLRSSKRIHWDIIPASGNDRYYLDQFSWVQRPGDVVRLLRRNSPFLGRNGRFEDWNTVSSAGALEPDVWRLSGAAATWTRSTTNPYRGPYEVAVTRAGTDTVVRQFVVGPADADHRSLLHNGVESVRGKTVTIVVLCRASAGLALAGFIDDGVGGTTDTSFHTGNGALQELTASLMVDSAAVELSFGFYVSADVTVHVSECHLIYGSISDAVRRDAYQRTEVGYGFEAGAVPRIRPNDRATLGECYEIATRRPYATLDETRLWAGSADGDSIDVPVDLWAYGILAKCYQAYAGRDARYAELATRYGSMWNTLRLEGMADERPRNDNFTPVGGRARRL